MSNLAGMKIIALKFMRPIQMPLDVEVVIGKYTHKFFAKIIGTKQDNGIFNSKRNIFLN
jgi:hypothetical protein